MCQHSPVSSCIHAGRRERGAVMVCLTELQRSLEAPAVHVAPHAFQPQSHPGKGDGGRGRLCNILKKKSLFILGGFFGKRWTRLSQLTRLNWLSCCCESIREVMCCNSGALSSRKCTSKNASLLRGSLVTLLLKAIHF